jgi:hypothetical protein
VVSTPVLDVAIGLSLMFLFVSLLVTIAQESITSFLGHRAQNLYDALENLVGKGLPNPNTDDTKVKTLVDALYQHPQVKSLYRSAQAWETGTLKKNYLPSYIPSRVFAIALLDVLRGKEASQALGINKLLAGANDIVSKLDGPFASLKHPLSLLVSDADTFRGDLNDKAEAVSARIEEWFNDSMARASGWYKRRAQLWSFVIGFGAAVFLNADSLHVGMTLWSDSNLRTEVVAAAGSVAKDGTPNPDTHAVMAGLRESKLPVGWAGQKLDVPLDAFLLRILGWLVTGFAASLGAPFWFDLLNKALRLRGSGVPISARSGEPSQKKAEPAVQAPPTPTPAKPAAAEAAPG